MFMPPIGIGLIGGMPPNDWFGFCVDPPGIEPGVKPDGVVVPAGTRPAPVVEPGPEMCGVTLGPGTLPVVKLLRPARRVHRVASPACARWTGC